MLMGSKATYRPPVEYIGTVSTTDINGSWSITVSSLDIQEGDIGVLAFTSDFYSGTYFGVTPSMTKIYDSNDGHPWSQVYSREMDGTETSFSSTGSAVGVAQIIIFMLFRNALKPTASELAHHNQTSGMPNPPSIDCTDGDMLMCTGHHNGQLLTGSCTQTDFTVTANRNSQNAPYYATAAASYKPTLQEAGSYNPWGFVWSPIGTAYNDGITIRLRQK